MEQADKIDVKLRFDATAFKQAIENVNVSWLKVGVRGLISCGWSIDKILEEVKEIADEHTNS